jgi:glutaredoxin
MIPRDTPVQITLLTQASCHWCEHAKDVLRSLGADFPLNVTEVALDSAEGQALARDAGILFAPGVVVDGAAFSYGRLSARRLRRELAGRRLGP